MPEPDHQERMLEAMRLERDAQRALLAGDPEAGRAGMREAARLWRESWEAAPPTAFGRLVGMLKAATLAGGGEEAAPIARAALGDAADSPTSAYALAIAALLQRDDPAAARAAATMRSGSEAFGNAADAIGALAARDAPAYERALRAIVADFEAREEHLTGVPFADTALMLEALAEPRGMAVHPVSPVLPAR